MRYSTLSSIWPFISRKKCTVKENVEIPGKKKNKLKVLILKQTIKQRTTKITLLSKNSRRGRKNIDFRISQLLNVFLSISHFISPRLCLSAKHKWSQNQINRITLRTKWKHLCILLLKCIVLLFEFWVYNIL